MANLPETGVRLVAENEGGFLRSLNKATGAVKSFESGTKSAGVGAIALGTAVGNLAAGAIRNVAHLFTQAAGATASFLSGSVTMAADLEAQMSGVAAVLGVGTSELDELNQLVIDLGIDPNLKVSSLEAAEAIEVLAKNGLDMAQIMDGAARQTVFLANATSADFGTAADIATDVMNIFGFSAENMGDAVDGITSVVQSSKFDINDFALALANGGAVAASVGVSFEDFNTSIAAISPSFSSGMTAGTAMKNLLLRLVPSTKKAEDEMARLGIITADGANQFFDAEGNMKSMSEITGVLQNALGGLSEQQKTATLRTIFGNDAMGAAIALAEIGQDEFEALGLSMASVDAGAAAQTRVSNFAGAMDIASGAIEAVRLQIGNAFLPILTEMAKRFSSFVETNGPKFVAFFDSVAKGISAFFLSLQLGIGIIDAFGVALGAAGVPQNVIDKITGFANSVKDVIAQIVAFVSEHKEAFIGALKGIGVVLAGAAIAAAISGIGTALGLLFSPIGLLVAGVALLGAIWETNFMGIQETTSQVAVIVVFGLNEMRKAATSFGAEMLSNMKAISDSSTALATTALPILATSITKLSIIMRTRLSAAFTSFKVLAKKVWDLMKLGIEGVIGRVNGLIGAINALITKINQVPGINIPGLPTIGGGGGTVTGTRIPKGQGTSPPASPTQQSAGGSTTNNRTQNVTLNNNFSGQPQVTDRNVLLNTLAGVQ